MNPLTVRAFGAAISVAPHIATMAGLPASLRLVSEGPCDIALAAPDSASLKAGCRAAARAVVVADPADLSDMDIAFLIGAGLPVFPSLRLAANLQSLGSGLLPTGTRMVRSRLDWSGSARAAAIEHLAGLTTLLGPLDMVQTLTLSAAIHSGTARSQSGIDILWSNRLDGDGLCHELDAIGLDQRLEIVASLGDTAQPAKVTKASQSGLQQPPGIYESSLRLFWRSIVAELSGLATTRRWEDFLATRTVVGRLSPETPSDAAQAS